MVHHLILGARDTLASWYSNLTSLRRNDGILGCMKSKLLNVLLVYSDAVLFINDVLHVMILCLLLL
jgi:hypothetical protein